MWKIFERHFLILILLDMYKAIDTLCNRVLENYFRLFLAVSKLFIKTKAIHLI